MNENDILKRAYDLIPQDLRSGCSLYIQRNAENTSYSSLCVKLRPTDYNSASSGTSLLARIKLTGKMHYISFSESCVSVAEKLGIPYSKTKSEPFLRVDLDYFLSPVNDKAISSLLSYILLHSFNFPQFGCCARYKLCSQSGKCVHPDIFYASSACSYKLHLDQGNNFLK